MSFPEIEVVKSTKAFGRKSHMNEIGSNRRQAEKSPEKL